MPSAQRKVIVCKQEDLQTNQPYSFYKIDALATSRPFSRIPPRVGHLRLAHILTHCEKSSPKNILQCSFTSAVTQDSCHEVIPSFLIFGLPKPSFLGRPGQSPECNKKGCR